MKKMLLFVLCIACGLAGPAHAGDRFPYKVKGEHKGGDVTPTQAWEMVQKDPEHTFIVDVRTRSEYQDIGHPAGAINIPWLFATFRPGKDGYDKVLNPNFAQDLLARFNPKTDTLLLLCRSAERTIAATTAAVDAGFPAERVFNVLGGFEGDKEKNPKSPDLGKRTLGGWRLEGLPWTYDMNPKLMYRRDFQQ
ncbi:MAG: rhodanese-like domain-containing protein [Thermodesulfobacteriota bacterium]